VSNQTTYKFRVEGFKHKNLSSIVLKSQIGLRLWKILTLKLMLIENGKLLERIPIIQLKRI
jgi:hypothetical protein